MTDENRAARLWRRFRGLERAHGKYVFHGGKEPNGKVDGHGEKGKGPLTEALFRQHIAGTYSLGVFPLTDRGTVYWAALDIDDYHMDPHLLRKAIAAHSLPLLLCRTKSGGIHAYVFFTEEESAVKAREFLKRAAQMLGYPGVEIFPKQDALKNGVDFGNWINIPYYGGDESFRYALDPQTGERLTLDQFLDKADSLALKPGEIERRQGEILDDVDDLPEAPPCVAQLHQLGLAQGTRNNGLFNVGVYYSKVDPQNVEELLVEYNNRYVRPKMSEREVRQIARSVKTKKYSYKCNDEPAATYCEKQACLRRKYGIGSEELKKALSDEEQLDDITFIFKDLQKNNTRPPTWNWTVRVELDDGSDDEKVIELTTEEFMTPALFAKRVLEEMDIVYQPPRKKKWNEIMHRALKGVEIVEGAPEASPRSRMLVELEKFCATYGHARSKDEVMMGKAFIEGGRMLFQAADFLRFLDLHKIRGMTERQIANWLRQDRDLTFHIDTVKGRQLHYWSVRAFNMQTEPYDIPREEDEGVRASE